MNDESSSLARKLIDVHEYQIVAKARMPKMFYDFYASGAEDEWTLKENQKAFQRIWILPRIPLDVGKVELSTSILGFKVSSPIMIAPTALHKLAHPEGELATARAAIAADTIMVLSTTTSTSIEDVAAVGAGIRFFQLYIYKKTKTVELVRRAEEAGYKAIVLTVDSPVMGRREADLRNRFVFPPDVSMKLLEDVGNQQQLRTKTAESQLAAFIARNMDRSVTWKDVKWLQSITKLPVLLKGVLTAEATQHAIEAGVAGVIVSNHGARQLDYVSPTICALEEVVAAARGRIPVLFDGGIRRGTDVFKALALGACGVFVGRPVLFGLAVDGETGVKDVLEMLKDELEAAMNFASCFIVSDIKPTCIRSSFSRL